MTIHRPQAEAHRVPARRVVAHLRAEPVADPDLRLGTFEELGDDDRSATVEHPLPVGLSFDAGRRLVGGDVTALARTTASMRSASIANGFAAPDSMLAIAPSLIVRASSSSRASCCTRVNRPDWRGGWQGRQDHASNRKVDQGLDPEFRYAGR